jgi:lipopolysaccharide export system permease protein
MLSNKIYKHFFLELSKYFFITLFTFTAIVWTVQAVNFLDLVVEDGHALSVYLGYSLLNVPKILTKFIPLSFLISLVLAIIKFENDNELIILWTAGVNKMKLVNFFLKVSLLVTLFQLFFASIINPNILNYSRSLIKSSNLDFISSMVKTNQFNDTVPGLTIFVEEKNEDGNMENIFIRDESRILKSIDNIDSTDNITIIAKKGKVVNPSSPALVLVDGIIQSQKVDKNIQTIKFQKTVLKLDNLQTRSIVQTKIQETPSILLIQCYFNKNKQEIINCPRDHKKNDVLSEINRRLGMPLYIPVITLIVCFLLNPRNENKFKNYFKYFYALVAFLILVVAEILVKYSGKSFNNSLIYYLTPFLLIPLIYLEIIRNFFYENLRKK